MFLPKALLLSLLTLTLTAATPISTCSASACCPDSLKIKACQQEITTIRSHSLSDAAAIDLAPSATRTFFLTLSEPPYSTIQVPAGIDALTTRTLLAILASVLGADVPAGSESYTVNGNDSVTSDFVQTDTLLLPYVHVREVHEFNDACEITSIVGYIHGDLANVTASAVGALQAFLSALEIPI